MDHKSLNELRELLQAARSKVAVGAKYYHYKNPDKFYTVTGLSILEATDDVAVKYALVDNPDIEFVRAFPIWLETVAWNNQTVPRFTKAS